MSSGASGSNPNGLLPPAVRAFFARVSGLVRALGKPARILIATTAIAAAGVGLWLAMRAAYEPYAVLFTQLEREDAGAVIAKLKEMHVPYRVTGDGSVVEVPEARANELRLELASAGLPRGGGIGFEGFDNMRLGATEFEQRVLYRRAMEGELARTIGGIAAIRSARVHLVLPEKSVFAARREPASASVIVRLRPGRALGPSEVNGIVHLVAAAVPGLTSDRIALVTTEGIALHRPRSVGADGAADATDPEGPPSRAIESTLEERSRALLERLLGPGHVDVRVTADVDLARVERTEDHYDPATTVLRSEEATREHAASTSDDTVAGVPGAESNLPTSKDAGVAGTTTTPAAGGPLVRETHTRNFEVDHVQEKRVITTGVLKRITVAVVVDGAPGPDGRSLVPRGPAELDKLAKLVRSAVGADDKRGDVVTVESVPFLDTEPPVATEAPPSIVSRLPAPVRRYGVYAGGGALGLLILFALSRSRRPKVVEPPAEPLELTAPPAPRELPEASPVPAPALAREEAMRQAKQDPATATLVVRYWLGTHAQEAKTDAAA